MKLLDRLSSFFGMSDDEEMEFNDFEGEEQEYSAPHPSITNKVTNQQQPVNQAPRQSFYQRSMADHSKDYSTNQSAQSSSFQQQASYQQQSYEQKNYQSRNVVSMQQSRVAKSQAKSRAVKENHGNKIIIIEPRAYSEAMKIAKHIMNGESVLVNFHQIEEYQARRIVDFLTGTVYAENGDIKRVGNEIFLCTAQGVEIDGTAQSLMDANMLEIQ